jgi:phage recombination protein Bet
MTFDLAPKGIDPEISAALVIADRLTPLKDALGLKDLSESEIQLFAMVAHHTGLDPFTRQIYAIKRGGKVTHQTGIDGYRSTAERTHEYAGSDEATFEACDCGSPDSPTEHPKVARVVVHRILSNGHVVNQTGIARWHELKPDHRKPQNAYDFLDAMWWKMPFNQLAKCGEAAGLRIAFPRVLGGVYIEEEMQQADTLEGTATVLPTAQERIAARRAAVETGNAGHTDAAGEPQAEPTAEPSAPGLSREGFNVGLIAGGIAADYAVARAATLFPGVEPRLLTDAQRAELLADLTRPDDAPSETLFDAEMDAAAAAV